MEVRDDDFAAALASIGVPFATPSAPFTLVEDAKGVRRAIWRFAPTTSDGKADTSELCKAVKDPEAWCKQHPQHPLCFALAAILNVRRFREATAAGRALVAFELKGGQTIFVYEGSRKAKRLEAMGTRRI